MYAQVKLLNSWDNASQEAKDAIQDKAVFEKQISELGKQETIVENFYNQIKDSSNFDDVRFLIKVQEKVGK